MQVSSLAVRILAHIARQLGLQEGNNVKAIFSRHKSYEEAEMVPFVRTALRA